MIRMKKKTLYVRRIRLLFSREKQPQFKTNDQRGGRKEYDVWIRYPLNF